MAYTLTFDDSVYCRVNDVIKDSPYTLRNGDVITVIPNYANFVVNNTTYSASTANTIDISNSDITITKGASVPALNAENTTINFSEATASRISIDMSTLPGWANLASGSHTLTIKAKADGYKDSEASAAVNVEKAGTSYNVSVIVQVENFTNSADFDNYFRIYDGDDTGNIVKEWTTQPTWGETAEVTITTGKLTFKMSGSTSAHSLRATTSDSGITIGKTVNLYDIVHTPMFFGATLECIINSTGGIIVSANYNTSD